MDKGIQRDRKEGALHETTTGKPEGCAGGTENYARGCQSAHGGQTGDLGRVHQEQKWRRTFWEANIFKILLQWNNLPLNAAEMASLGS